MLDAVIVSNQQRQACYEVADSGVWGRQLISQQGRKTIVDKTIAAFQVQMDLDPNQFTKGDRELIIDSVKSDPEVATFVILPTIILAVVGWIVSKVLDALWDWWQNKGISEQVL